jgi:hypothetical protein
MCENTKQWDFLINMSGTILTYLIPAIIVVATIASVLGLIILARKAFGRSR